MSDQQLIRQLERASIADETASSLRHELRNKLASIRNAAFFLMRKMQESPLWTADDRVPTFFELIDKESNDAERILSELIPQAPVERPERRRTSVRAACERALALSAARPTARLEQRITSDGWILGDPDQLVLAFRCVLDNAAEATPDGGAISVEIRQNGGCFEVEVADTGPGVPERERATVFAAFVTNKPGHAGLGLPIARRILQRHGGHIELRARAGGGTSVQIRLPAEPPVR